MGMPEHKAKVAELPPWILEKLIPPPATKASQNGHSAPPQDVGEMGAHWLGKALEKVAGGAYRNRTGLWLACQLRDAGMTERDASLWMELYAIRVPAGDHAYTERDALATLRSAFGWPKRDPAKGTTSPPSPHQDSHTFPPPPDTTARDAWESIGNNVKASGAGSDEHQEQAYDEKESSEATGKTYWPGVRRLSEVAEREYRWWWHPYLIRNKANVMEGDPGVGKSLLIALLTARETRGQRMEYDTRPGWALGHPDADGLAEDPGGTVLLLPGEDDTEDTVKPRVVAASGDPARVIVLEKVPYQDAKGVTRYRRPRFPTDTPAVLKIVRAERCRAVIVDPITSFLDKDVSPNSDTEMRAAMDPLVDGCKAANCATLFTRHLNKGSGQSALHRGAGTMGIAELARSVVMVADDPDAPEGVEQHVFGHVKSNIARKGSTLVFQKVVQSVPDAQPTLDWQGTSLRKPDDIYRLLTQKLAGQAGDQRQERLGRQLSERLRKAVDWLCAEFAQMPGEGLPSKEIIAHGQAKGYSEKHIRNAAAYLKVDQSREGYQGITYWHFDPSKDPDATQGDGEDTWP